MKPVISALIRHLLTLGGGAAFAKSDTEIEQLTSALFAVAGVAWSLWEKYQRSKTSTSNSNPTE